MSERNRRFAEELLGGVSDRPFQPFAYFDPDGDYVEFLFSADDYYARRADEMVTLYFSRTTNELIGTMLKGLSRFVREKAPGLRIEIEEGPVRISHLLRFYSWASGPFHDDDARNVRRLIERAEETKVVAELVTA